MRAKGLIRYVNNNSFTYTKLARDIFDPGLIVDFGVAYYKKIKPKAEEYGLNLIYHEDKILTISVKADYAKLRVLTTMSAVKFIESKIFPTPPRQVEVSIRRCPKCGSIVDLKDRYCSNCGARL